jgi:single-strand DNA-binding protein
MYLNDAHVSLTGYVATQPVTRTVNSGATNTSMRVAWTPRRQDRVTGEWADGNTSYVTVICWRKLATHAAMSLRKGDPVVVRGRLSIRSYEDKNGLSRTAVEVEASTVGHDLSRGVAMFSRTRPQTGLTATEFARSSDGSTEGDDASRADSPEPLNGSGEFAASSQVDTSGQVSDGNDPEELDESLFNQNAISDQPADLEPAAAPF